MKVIIKEIVVVLLQKAFPLGLRYKVDISSSDSFESLGLSHNDVAFFIIDFIQNENVPFFLYERHVFKGDTVGDMVEFINNSSFLDTGNSLSKRVSLTLLLNKVKTVERDEVGMAIS